MARYTQHTDQQILTLLASVAVRRNAQAVAEEANAAGLDPPISPRTLRHWTTSTYSGPYRNIARRVEQHRQEILAIDHAERQIKRLHRKARTAPQRLDPTTAHLRIAQYEMRTLRLQHQIERAKATLPTHVETLLRTQQPGRRTENVPARVSS